jgi:hypothetical protein
MNDLDAFFTWKSCAATALMLMFGLWACSNAFAQVAEPRDFKPADLLRIARSVSVCSRDNTHIPPDTLIAEVLAQKGFRDFDLNFTRDTRAADLVIQIDHPLHFWDFSYLVIDRRTNIVLASGSVIAWDGIRAAPLLARKIVDDLKGVQRTNAPQLKRRPAPDADGESK